MSCIARDTKRNRDVALKVLPDAFALDPNRLARFKREAQLLASLNHPNIAAIYGLEEGPAEAGPYVQQAVGAGFSRPDTMSPTITTPAGTRIGMILGIAAYMAPEQARGRAVDKRADIWAFGCVLFEMLTGTRAFEGEDVAETLGAVIHKEPAWSALPAGTPPYLRTLLRRCLQQGSEKAIAAHRHRAHRD